MKKKQYDDALFQLVHSLSGKELKRVEALGQEGEGSGRDAGKGHDYLALFHAILGFEGEDEASFKAQHEGESYLRHYSQKRAYLMAQILKVLRQMKPAREESSPELEVRELVEEAEILDKRMIRDEAVSRLQKAAQRAEEAQFLEIKLEVLRRMRTFMNEETGRDYGVDFPNLLEEIRATGEAIAESSRLIAIRDTFSYSLRCKSPSVSKTLVEEALTKLNQEREPARPEARINYHNAWGLYHSLRKDWGAAWPHFRDAYAVWRAHEDFRMARWAQYFKSLNNYMTVGIEVGQYTDFDQVILDLKRHEHLNPLAAKEARQNLFFLQLQLNMALHQWSGCKALEEEYGQSKDLVPLNRPTRLSAIALMFARNSLILGQPENVLGQLGVILKRPKEFPEERLEEAKVLELLSGLDLMQKRGPDGKDPMLLIRAVETYLQRRTGRKSVLPALFSGLRRVFNSTDDEAMDTWRALQADLASMTDIKEDYASFVMNWVSAKALGMPLAAYMGDAPKSKGI